MVIGLGRFMVTLKLYKVLSWNMIYNIAKYKILFMIQ